MKEFHLLVWITQLGLGAALPMAGTVYLGLWLRTRFGLGLWVMIVCVALGLFCAVGSLISSVRAMERMSKPKQEEASPISFNHHQ